MKRMVSVLLAIVLSGMVFTGMFEYERDIVGKAEAASGDFGGGDGNEENPYLIEDVWDLQNMTLDLNAHYVLVDDIDVTITSSWNGGAGFRPIGNGTAYFNGTFDGCGHRIYNLTINRSTEDHIGLFGYLNESATINDLGLENVNIIGKNIVGVLAGNNNGIITNCYSTGNSIGRGTSYVSSFTGNNNGIIINCYSTGNANATGDYVGGFAGCNGGTITNCCSTGNASVTGSYYVGGFVGLNAYGEITNCYSTGVASGDRDVGGFAGYNHGQLTNCYSTGNVIGEGSVGGFTGYHESGTIAKCFSTSKAFGTSDRIGGFAGYNVATITYCYSTDNASGSNMIGGFVGYNEGDTTNCYSTGRAIGTGDYVGGFVGFNPLTITNCYSTGTAGGANNVGGFAGANTGIITDCYWDVWTSATVVGIGSGGLTGATGKTTAELKMQATFDPSWDFYVVWTIFECVSYPYFQWDAPIILMLSTILSTTGWNETYEDTFYSFEFDAIVPLLPGSPNTLTWNVWTDRDAWLSIDTTGTISGTPSNADVGEHQVTITVTDLAGRTGKYGFTLIVINSAPEITTGDITEIVSGNMYYNDYDSTDDGQGTITWSMETNVTWLNTISFSGVLISIPSNDDAGTYWINISVDDGNDGTDSTNFTLEVKMDSDLDGIPDDEDDDDDNDGVIDVEDDFLLDPAEWTDTDGDGTGNNADSDDDGDGWLDDLERTLGTDPLNNMSVPSDMDGDDIADLLDNDMDGDGHSNGVDAFPEDPGEWLDSDRDGVGDNSDEYPFDMDNDGHNDTVDAFPMDPTRWETPVINNTVYGTQVKYYNRTVYNNQTIIPPMGDLYLNDTDGDGMPDSWELLYGLDPEDPSDASLDPDEDGISNLDEYKGGTSPTSADVEASDAGDESETPVWAWIAVAAAVILAVIVIILLMGRGGKKEELEGSGEYPEENDTEGGREE